MSTHVGDAWVSHDDDGQERWVFDKTKALAEMLSEGGIMFALPCKGRLGMSKEEVEITAVVVNCNDVFVWACSELEPVPCKEIEALYDLWKNTPNGWGAMKWACIRRNEQPQDGWKEMMQNDGVWCERMEALEPNAYWSFLKEEEAKKENESRDARDRR